MLGTPMLSHVEEKRARRNGGRRSPARNSRGGPPRPPQLNDYVIQSVEPVVAPTLHNPEATPPHVQEAFRIFSGARKRVVPEKPRFLPCEPQTLTPQKFEMDIPSTTRDGPPKREDGTDADNVREELLVHSHARLPGDEARVSLFRCYEPEFEWFSAESHVCERRPLPERLEDGAVRFTVECLSFELGLQDLEPLFCSLALYDLATHAKVSEDFHVDLNTERARSGFNVALLLGGMGEDLGRTALFSVSDHPLDDIFLVLHVEKILGTTDPKTYLSPYKHPESKTASDRSKLHDKLSESAVRLGEFRQAFLWSALRLLDKNRQSLLEGEVKFSTLNRVKESLSLSRQVDLIQESLDPKKHPKTIPGCFTIRITHLTDSKLRPSTLLDASMQRLVVPPDQSMTHDPGMTREVMETPVRTPVQPVFGYRNIMYLYPEGVTGLEKYRNISVMVGLHESDAEIRQGLEAIFRKTRGPDLSTSAFSQVTYHRRDPVFGDEFKIWIPDCASQNHHFLFTFWNISCANPKKAAKTAIGYSVLPLFESQNRLLSGPFVLPVFVNLPKNYRSFVKPNATHSALFRLSVVVASSVYPTNFYLASFFTFYPTTGHLSDAAMIRGIGDLLQTDSIVAAPFLYHILNQLFRSICVGSETVRIEAQRAMTSVLSRFTAQLDDESERNDILLSYVQNIFRNPPDIDVPVFSRLLKTWILCLKNRKAEVFPHIVEGMLEFSWFFLDVMSKSIFLFCLEKGTFGRSLTSEFVDDVKALTNRFLTFLADGSLGVLARGKLNRSLALFVHDLYSVATIDQVSEIVEAYFSETAEKGNLFVDYRLEFLRIVTDHEYFLEYSFSNRRIISILLAEVSAVCGVYDVTRRAMALSLLRDLLAKHEYDTRYASKEMREEVAHLYLPFLAAVLRKPPTMYQMGNERRDFYCAILFICQNYGGRLVEWMRDKAPTAAPQLLRLLQECLIVFEYKGGSEKKAADFGNPEKGPTTTLSLSIVEKYFRSSTVSNFMAAVERSSSSQDANKGIASSRSRTNRVRSMQWNASGSPRSRVGLVKDKYKTARKTAQEVVSMVNMLVLWEGNLSTEVSFVVHDIMLHIIKTMVVPVDTVSEEMKEIFGLVLLFLKRNQSHTFVTYFFSSLRVFIHDFREILFSRERGYCFEICQGLLRQFESCTLLTRSEACASTYLMIRNNIEERGNFSRVRVCILQALHELLQESEGVVKVNVQHCFNTLPLYAKADLERPTSRQNRAYATDLSTLVEDVTSFAHTCVRIIRTYASLSHLEVHPPRYADLLSSLADCYVGVPPVRDGWLRKLSEFQQNQGSIAEAGLCLLHVAFIVAEKLIQKEPGYKTIVDALSQICSDYPLVSEEDEKLERHQYNEDDLVSLLRSAADLLLKAKLHEWCIDVIKMVIPFLEKHRNYSELSRVHTALGGYYNEVVQANHEGYHRWTLAQYYRVGFYGEGFREDNKCEYIYREDMGTRLGDIKDKLADEFSRVAEAAKIHFITDSSKTDVSKLDPSTCYIQVTAVEPFFNEGEHRFSYFEKNTNLGMFVFSTPFTLLGPAQGLVVDQCKRKTILSVKSSFPCTRKRLPVQEKHEVTLTPIQNSIEVVEQKTEAINSELEQTAPDIKTLQHVLQGSVRPQVNAGPLEIARSFLSKPDMHNPDDLRRLQTSLRSLVQACEKGIALNRQLMEKGNEAAEQFHAELERGCTELQEGMNVLAKSQSFHVGRRKEMW